MPLTLQHKFKRMPEPPECHLGAEAVGIASLLREQVDQHHYEVGWGEGPSPPTWMALPERFPSRFADRLDPSFKTPFRLPATCLPRGHADPAHIWHSYCLYG
jgi:hypothetical protein